MAYRHGSLSVAAQAFARALELDPDRPGVRQNYGKLLRELERYADSERELRLAAAQSEDDRAHARQPGRDAGRANGRTREAAHAARCRAGARNRRNPEALGVKGRLLAGAGQGAGGAAVLREGDRDVRSGAVHRARARLSRRRRRWQGARHGGRGAAQERPGIRGRWRSSAPRWSATASAPPASRVSRLLRRAGRRAAAPDGVASLAEGFEAANDPARAAVDAGEQAAALARSADHNRVGEQLA